MQRERLHRLRQTREATLSLVVDLSQEEIDDRSGDHWSIGQILDHLIRADATYGGEIRRLIELERAGKRPSIVVGLAEMEFAVPLIPKALLPAADVPMAVFNYFLPNRAREFFLRNPVVAAESPAALKPAEGRSKEDLVDGLRESLKSIELLFLENLDLDFTALHYYHPLFGYNDAYDILGLMRSHEQRHQKQMQARLAALAKP